MQRATVGVMTDCGSYSKDVVYCKQAITRAPVLHTKVEGTRSFAVADRQRVQLSVYTNCGESYSHLWRDVRCE
jgi:hypothetical protein